jgi:hypothetical protein
VAYLTAHMAFSLAGFQAGKTVLSPAIGGSVGNAVTQLARALGARHAMSTTTSHAKAEHARTLGFDEVIDLSREKLGEGVRRITGGYGFGCCDRCHGRRYIERGTTIRSGIGPASRRHTACRAGRAQKTSSHKTQEPPPAGPHRYTVCWFPRWASPAFYDRLMHECYRGGLKSPRIVQEGLNEATILSLVSTGLGVGWVLGTARWRSPETVVILPVVDLNMPLPLALAWRRDNSSPLLANFIGEVQRLPDVRAVNKGRWPVS